MSITVTITAEAVPSGASGNGEVSRSHCARSPPWTSRSAATIDRQRTALSDHDHDDPERVPRSDRAGTLGHGHRLAGGRAPTALPDAVTRGRAR